jgi:hypothetical protein
LSLPTEIPPGEHFTQIDSSISPDTVKALEPLQLAALWAALGIGVLILVIAIPLTIDWLLGAPNAPDLKGLTQEQTQNAVETYRTLVQIHEAAAQTRFDTIILKALLPVLTLTLGYLFGTQTRRE